nr:hypothetical protein [uncultured Psychroserpens sp.]
MIGTSKHYEEDLGFYTVTNTIGIEIKNVKIVVDYSPAHVPKEKEFASIEDAIEFIKEVRPLQ